MTKWRFLAAYIQTARRLSSRTVNISAENATWPLLRAGNFITLLRDLAVRPLAGRHFLLLGARK